MRLLVLLASALCTICATLGHYEVTAYVLVTGIITIVVYAPLLLQKKLPGLNWALERIHER